MSKGMSPQLEAHLATAEIIPRMLVTIYTDDVVLRFVANDTKDLTFEGNVYTSADIKRGEINTSTAGDKEKVEIIMSNKWQEWAAYFANNYKGLKYKKCVIQEVYLGHLEEGAIWRFEGIINSPQTSIVEFRCVIERDTVDYSQDAPSMDYSPTCQFVYKGNRCRATSSFAACDGTIPDCKERGNVTRYGGHPSIPRQAVIRT